MNAMQASDVNEPSVSAAVKADTRRSLDWCVETSVIEAAGLLEELLCQLDADAALFGDINKLFERLESHLDALRIAGASAWPLIDGQLESPAPGLVFVATVLSLEQRQSRRLKLLIALAEADPTLHAALFHAFGWVPLALTQPLLPHLLSAASLFYRQLGLQLCRQHQVHADTELERAITHPDVSLQVMALDVIGETGALDLLPYVVQRLSANDPLLCFAACRACLLLGERDRALPVLMQFVLKPSVQQKAALTLLTAFLPVAQAQQFLASIGRHSQERRLLVQLAGELGDPANIPALLHLMQDVSLSRIAGHAFSVITGLDLVAQNRDRPAPQNLSAGPSDNPDDDNVDADPDDALPWPDHKKVAQWWAQHGGQFQPGQRYLMGQAVTPRHCLQVLRQGDQLQRRAAALQLKAINPASALFQVDAPAWRQTARLASLAVAIP